MKRLLPCAALVLAIAPLNAQTVDFLEQHVTADLSTTPGNLHVELRARALTDLAYMDIYTPGMPVNSVLFNGADATLQDHPIYRGQLSRLMFPQTWAANAEATVSLDFDLVSTCVDSGDSRYDACVLSNDEVVLPPPGPGSGWAFGNAFEEDVYTATFEVVAPANMFVVAGQGAPLSVTEEQGGNVRRWQFAQTTPTELMMLYARASDVAQAGQSPVVQVYHPGRTELDAAVALHMAELGSGVVGAYSAMFGAPPTNEIHLLFTSGIFPFAGMGLLGNVLLQELLLDFRYAYLVDQGVAHELGHTWWGNMASGLSASDETPFMHEAFAEYSAWRALAQVAQDDHVRVSGVRTNTVWYLFGRPNDVDVATLTSDARSSAAGIHAIYHKGSSVLRTMEALVGQQAFTTALANLVARGPQALTISNLQDEVIMASGISVATVVDQFLRARGYPQLLVQGFPDDGNFVLRLDVVGNYDVKVPVVVYPAAGQAQNLVIDAHTGANQLVFDATPVLVEVDPEWTLVRTVEPLLVADVTVDGQVDAADLLEVALRVGGAVPAQRRIDGQYDPLFDINADRTIDRADLDAVLAAAQP